MKTKGEDTFGVRILLLASKSDIPMAANFHSTFPCILVRKILKGEVLLAKYTNN
jgi:hypothetical protein